MVFAETRSVGARAGFGNGFNAKYADSACLDAVSAMKLRANVVALFFFEFRNECERIGRYRS